MIDKVILVDNELYLNILDSAIKGFRKFFPLIFEFIYNYFQMEAPSCREIKQQNSYKIYFPEKVFGKPTKNRKQDPNMFELLTWGTDGFEKHAFKKDEKFKEPAEAYLNMIGKNPWTSESQQNYVDYHQHCIQANAEVLNKIQNYIQDRLPDNGKAEKKSPQKNIKKIDKKLNISDKDEKKQNKYLVNNYLSPKAISKKYIQNDNQAEKHFRRSSSGEHQKSSKKLKIKDESKYQSQHKQMQNKTYGQVLQKNKQQNQQITEKEQQNLIDHFKQTTRWIPNSAFTTYFGKPPFENYGRGNTNPIDGGLVYGTYLYSHNVHPHRGKNHPKFIQSYPVALMKAKSQGTLIPTHPRTKPEVTQDVSKVVGYEEYKSKIQPQANSFAGNLNIEVPKLNEIQKFGGKRGSRVSMEAKNN